MGSNPIQGTVEERVGWAPASPSGCNPPAIAVQVQLLPDTLHVFVNLTLEPDGQATGCNPVEVGSTPTGVSRGAAHPGAPQDRLFKQAAGPVGPAARLPRLRTVGGACPVQGIGTGAGPGRGSSEVEHQARNLGVTGSTPVHNTPQSAVNR